MRRPEPEYPAMTVADLNDDYAGWYLKVKVPGPIGWHHLELKRVRSHELFSGTVTALVAKDHDGVWAGIEHHFQNGAQVVLERPITAKAKAKRKAKELTMPDPETTQQVTHQRRVEMGLVRTNRCGECGGWITERDGKWEHENMRGRQVSRDDATNQPLHHLAQPAAAFLVRGEHPIMAEEGFDPNQLYREADDG